MVQPTANENAGDALKNEYDSTLTAVKGLCEQIADQMTDLLGKCDITLAQPVEARVKSWESIIEKVKRKQKFYSSITEILDLVGIRIVTLFHDDVARCANEIKSNFKIDQDEDTSRRLGDSEFGYQSVHYNVRMKADWRNVPSFRDLPDLPIEIQLRTASQHIWALASHKLQYKNEKTIPSVVRRSIFRVSALLEMVDLEFKRVVDTQKEYRRIDHRNPDEPINIDLIAEVLKEEFPDHSEGNEPGLPVLLDLLNQRGVNNYQQLKDFVGGKKEKILKTEQMIIDEFRAGGRMIFSMAGKDYGLAPNTLENGKQFTRDGLLWQMIYDGTTNEFKAYVRKEDLDKRRR